MTNETRENVDLLIRLANTQAMSQFEDALRELLAENEALKAEQRENLTNGFAAGVDHERRKSGITMRSEAEKDYCPGCAEDMEGGDG